MSLSRTLLILGVTVTTSVTALANESQQAKNKRLVVEFYNLAFNRHRPIEAANKYLAERYIQHNPRVADGRAGFIEAFKGVSPDDPFRSDIKRVLADGDLVVLHSHAKAHPGERGSAVIDIFRVSGELITEHWDVAQKLPETAKNPNSPF